MENQFPTLADLPEGKKFCYALSHNKIVFLKLLQPKERNLSAPWKDLEILSDAYWCVIIDNQNDIHPMLAVGRIISLNSGILVREVQ